MENHSSIPNMAPCSYAAMNGATAPGVGNQVSNPVPSRFDCLALKKVDSQKVNKMIKFQSLPRQKRQAIREEVLRMYAETDMSYVEIAEVNGVQLRTVEYIIRNFASELPETPVMRKNKKDASAEDYDALRAEITRLKKELRHEKMRAEALDTMIDVAEEMFNIPVRKKAGTKQ